MPQEYPVKNIHQVELSSLCNLACVYCPSRNLKRVKTFMDRNTFDHVLQWAEYFIRLGTQNELNLAGIGESTLHPHFIEFVRDARAYLGPAVRLTMATNGLLMTKELANALAPYKPEIWVSLHRPEFAGPAVEALSHAGILAGVSADPSISAINWAGQVDWHISHKPTACQWVKKGKVMVMADGNVTSCCLDADGSGVIGSIFDNLTEMQTHSFKLCATCSQRADDKII